jgi:hypothetical protein
MRIQRSNARELRVCPISVVVIIEFLIIVIESLEPFKGFLQYFKRIITVGNSCYSNSAVEVTVQQQPSNGIRWYVTIVSIYYCPTHCYRLMISPARHHRYDRFIDGLVVGSHYTSFVEVTLLILFASDSPAGHQQSKIVDTITIQSLNAI